jgi:outer membrane lipoprotein-sorting protein
MNRRFLTLFLTLILANFAATLHAMEKPEMVKMLQNIDERQRNSGDYATRSYIEQKEKGKEDLVYEALIYRRDDSDQFVLLFTKPKSEAGKGYLRLDKNLFLFDPTVGRWERRTERESIGGTNSRRSDFDESRLAEEFEPEFVGEETLGKFNVVRMKLTAKSGVEVAYPILEMWVDTATGNILKQQDFALSGKLMRTTYFPKWEKLYSESKKADVYFPKEIRIFDEVEKGKNTTIVFLNIDLSPLPKNIFTKAWVESKSR